MNSKNLHPTILTGIIVCVILVGYYGYLIVKGVTAGGSDQPAVATQVIDASIFSDRAFQTMASKNANGPLPLTVSGDEIGNSNPFQ